MKDAARCSSRPCMGEKSGSVARNVDWPREGERDPDGQGRLCVFWLGLSYEACAMATTFCWLLRDESWRDFQAHLSTNFDIRRTGHIGFGEGCVTEMEPRETTSAAQS